MDSFFSGFYLEGELNNELNIIYIYIIYNNASRDQNHDPVTLSIYKINQEDKM